MVVKKILPVREVRENLSRLLDEAGDTHEPVMITRYGRPAGYLIGYEILNRLLERLEELEDIRAMREAEDEWRARGGQPFEEALGEVENQETVGR